MRPGPCGAWPGPGRAPLVLAVLALMLPAGASAQQLITRPDRPPVESFLRLSGMVFENFFQAPADAPRLDIRSGTAELQVIFPLTEHGSLVQVRSRVVAYDGFDPAFGVGGGVRFVDGPGELELTAGYDRRLPRFDVGEELGRADVASASGRYSLRLGPPVQVSALASAMFQFYPEDAAATKNNFSFDAGGAIRYRGFGSLFSPELGATSGRLLGVDESEDFLQQSLYVQLRSLPLRGLYLSGRYRLRSRDYLVEDPGSRNFGREDRRTQISLIADLRTGPRLSWNVYYALEIADSTRPSRSFRTQSLGLGLAVRL